MIKLFCDINRLKKVSSLISKKIDKGDIIILNGCLGSGKTTFVKLVIYYLGGEVKVVTSPTYNILNVYKLEGLDVYHIDFYRLSSYREVIDISMINFNNSAVYIIEWGRDIKKVFSKYYEFFFYLCKKKNIRSIFTPKELI